MDKYQYLYSIIFVKTIKITYKVDIKTVFTELKIKIYSVCFRKAYLFSKLYI